jgi:hypothetical protein
MEPSTQNHEGTGESLTEPRRDELTRWCARFGIDRRRVAIAAAVIAARAMPQPRAQPYKE